MTSKACIFIILVLTV